MKMPAEIIREEIAKNRVIPFARFMELALYCPETGYYETNKDNVGRAGDFITSVSTGELFGELLAFQFAEWLQALSIADCRLPIVEAGAHDGKLAADILTWLKKNRAELFSKIEYWILEPSLTRQAWQQETLKKFTPHVRWFTDFENLKLETNSPKLTGIVFGNELLDAFPVHRYGWDAKNKNWFEWGVALADEKFIWTKMQSSEFRVQSWRQCCPIITPSKLRPPPKLGGAPPPAFWGAANGWRLITAIPPPRCFHPDVNAGRCARISVITAATTCWPIPANRI